VKKDEVEAVSWYRKAADQGDTLALHNLGGCYGSGRGVAKDEVEKYALWYLASITDEVTREALAEFEKFLPNDVIQLGKTRAKQLQKEINAKMAKKSAGQK
jgi:TPR repeat protein